MRTAANLEERIWRIEVQGHSVICIDYSHCREQQMIELGTLATDYLLSCDTPQRTLTNFKDTYATPAYVRHMEAKAQLVKHRIERNALVGVNTAKIMILKGFNLLLGTDFQPFGSEKEGIEYLIGEALREPIEPIFKN